MTDERDRTVAAFAEGIDVTRANAARAYDHMLGGAHNFAPDRELVEQLVRVNPPVVDLDRPVALLALAVLHFVPGDLTGVLAAYRARLVPGSVLSLSHGSTDQEDPEPAERLDATRDQYRRSDTPGVSRTRAELRALLDGLELVPPGLVDIGQWPEPRPDPPFGFYGAVARVP